MTVRELKATLDALGEGALDYLVVMSRDGEGNGFSPLVEVADGQRYVEENSWSGEIKLAELTDDLRMAGYTDEDVTTDGVHAVVLWPTN